MYYTLYPNEAAARDAIARLRADTRADWGVIERPKAAITSGLIAPFHKADANVAYVGIEVVTRGEFARDGERYAGMASYSHGFAWRVDVAPQA